LFSTIEKLINLLNQKVLSKNVLRTFSALNRKKIRTLSLSPKIRRSYKKKRVYSANPILPKALHNKRACDKNANKNVSVFLTTGKKNSGKGILTVGNIYYRIQFQIDKYSDSVRQRVANCFKFCAFV